MTNEPVWTKWLENPGTGENPVPEWAEQLQVSFRDFDTPEPEESNFSEDFRWGFTKEVGDIILYRYSVPPDLAWLAGRVEGWPLGYTALASADFMECPTEAQRYMCRSRDAWLRARRDLGYEQAMGVDLGNDDHTVTADVENGKVVHYRDHNGDDWIDEFSRTATPEEFRGAMRFTIGKYNRRAGKKDDLVKEIRKMRDYCDRWLEYEGDV